MPVSCRIVLRCVVPRIALRIVGQGLPAKDFWRVRAEAARSTFCLTEADGGCWYLKIPADNAGLAGDRFGVSAKDAGEIGFGRFGALKL